MLVSLGIAIPVVAHYKKKIAARHFTINYRLLVSPLIARQLFSLWPFFFFLNVLIIRLLLLAKGFTYSTSDTPVEFYSTLALLLASGIQTNLFLYKMLSSYLTEEKFESLFIQPPLPPLNRSPFGSIAVMLVLWVIALSVVLMNPINQVVH